MTTKEHAQKLSQIREQITRQDATLAAASENLALQPTTAVPVDPADLKAIAEAAVVTPRRPARPVTFPTHFIRC